MNNRIFKRIVYLLILGLIIINIFDFLEKLDPFWDFIKKIISWSFILILFYQISVSNILFGIKKRTYDFLFILSAFLLNIDNLISYASINRSIIISKFNNYFSIIKIKPELLTNINFVIKPVNETLINFMNITNNIVINNITRFSYELINNLTFSNPILYLNLIAKNKSLPLEIIPNTWNGSLLIVYNFIINNSLMFEIVSITIGLIILFLLSFYSLGFNIKKPSFFSNIFKERTYLSFDAIIVRILSFFIALFFFNRIIFRLFEEWLALAIDAPILIIFLIYVFYTIVKDTNDIDFKKWFEKTNNIITENYKKFIGLFHNKKTFLLGFAGLLVLHPLSDIFNFIIPYIVPLRDYFYFGELNPSLHENLFLKTLLLKNSVNKIINIIIVFWELLGFIVLLSLAYYVWYQILKDRFLKAKKKELLITKESNNKKEEEKNQYEFNMNNILLTFIISSLILIIIKPLVKIRPFLNKKLIGVDFITNWTPSNINLFLIILIISIIIFLLIELSENIKKIFLLIIIIVSVIIISIYSGFYLFSSSYYYFNIIFNLLNNNIIMGFGKVFLLIFFILNIIINFFFYVSGTIIYIYEIIKE